MALLKTIQLRVIALRNLTLGLMIVAGGVLAALPFRRTEPMNEPSFDSVPMAPSAVTNPSYPSAIGMLVDQGEPADEWIARLAPAPPLTPPPFPVHRELSAPLTYEQLAVPISRPDQIEERFTAVEKVRQSSSKNSKQVDAKLPVHPVQTTTVGKSASVETSPPQETKSVLLSETTETVSLASTPLGERGIEPLPKKSESTRERFWIRQP